MDDVRLPDLEVIKRFSIAVRREHAPADEVIAALRADLERISGGRRRSRDDDDDDRDESPRRSAARRPTPSRAAAKKKPSRR